MPATNLQVSYMLTKFCFYGWEPVTFCYSSVEKHRLDSVQLYLLCTAQVCPAKGAKRGDGVGRRSYKLGA